MGYDVKYSLENYKALIKGEIGDKSPIIFKHILLGKDKPVEAMLIYVNGLADKNILDRDILKPLLLSINENLNGRPNLVDYLAKKYVAMSNTAVQTNLNEAIINIKRGNAVIFINNVQEFLIIDTRGGMYRSITDPFIESAARGPRESFVENLEVNTSMIRRYIKDKNLVFEMYTLGQRTQTDLIVVYLKDVADDDVVNKVKERVKVIDTDMASAAGIIEQFIEDSTYSIFPQTNVSERVDKACAHILEGRVAILVEGTPQVITAPAIFTEFFHAVEDHYDRTLVANFTRILRYFAIFIVITASPLYLVFIKFNSELIPVNFILPIIESRRGIALSPVLEILLMEIVIEFLREGGLRLPSKIAQTLSVVGGIIVGDTAVKSKFVSPTTLFIIGISVVATFVIVNYEMSMSIRFIRFPMLILADILGVLGITIGWFILLVHILSLDSFGVPYLTVNKTNGLQDKFTRSPIWKLNKRGEGIPHKDEIRQKNFRSIWWRLKK